MTALPTHNGQRTCSTCAIRHRAVCGALSDAEIAELGRIGRFRDFAPGEVIFADDSPTTFFANVVSGVVKLEKGSADGRQQIVGLLFAPDFLGRAFAKRNPYFAIAATDVRLCTFPHSGFESLLRSHPDLEHRLFENTLSELDSAREWMFLLGRKSAAEKVASFLYLIAKRQPHVGCAHSDDATHIDLPLTRSDIADFLGLTIETVSRQVTRLKADGVIRLLSGREIVVPDIEALAARSGHDGEPG
ncbi:MAG: Crp/Fnr family transcriptional regulator [Hyphomicrobiaceae bacterium]